MYIKDIATVSKLAMAIISMFSLSDIQEKQINTYVKDNMYRWVEQRKRESEVENMIKNEIYKISGK